MFRHSMGGAIAIQVARRTPSLIRKPPTDNDTKAAAVSSPISAAVGKSSAAPTPPLSITAGTTNQSASQSLNNKHQKTSAAAPSDNKGTCPLT